MLYKYFRDITKNHENISNDPCKEIKSSSNSAEQEQWGRQIRTWRPICFSWAFRVAVITALCCLSSSVVDLSTTAALQLWPARAESSRVELSVQTSTALVLHTHTIRRHIFISQHWTIHVIHFINDSKKWNESLKSGSKSLRLYLEPNGLYFNLNEVDTEQMHYMYNDFVKSNPICPVK